MDGESGRVKGGSGRVKSGRGEHGPTPSLHAPPSHSFPLEGEAWRDRVEQGRGMGGGLVGHSCSP